MPLLIIPLLFIAFVIFVLTRKAKPAPTDAQLEGGALTSSSSSRQVPGVSVRALPSTALDRR